MSNPGNPIIFPIQMRRVQVAPNVNAIGNRLSQVFPEFEAKIRSLRDLLEALKKEAPATLYLFPRVCVVHLQL